MKKEKRKKKKEKRKKQLAIYNESIQF